MKRISDKDFIVNNYDQVLIGTPLFVGVRPEDISAMLLCLQAEFRKYERGEFVFHEGDAAGECYVVLEGLVQIVQDDYYGNRVLLGACEKGEIFAESFACAGEEILPVSAISQAESLVVSLNIARIYEERRICEFHQILVENMLRAIAKKNTFMNHRLRNSMHKSTRDKLLAFLMDEKRRRKSNSFTIFFNRQELADYLGVERSAMSAEISRMVADGLIKTKKNYFEIL